MTVEVSPLSPSTIWSSHVARWLGAQTAQNPENRERASPQDGGDQAAILAQPPRPIWPRVFPGL